MMFGLGKFAAVAATVIGMAAGSASAYAAEKDIVDTAVAAGQFKTLAAALTAAGLVDTLKGPGPFTVFAPTDAAFAKLSGRHRRDAAQAREQGQADGDPHLPCGARQGDGRRCRQAQRGQDRQWRDGPVKVDGGNVMINDAKVTAADIAASNGVIHVIDTVLLPPAN